MPRLQTAKEIAENALMNIGAFPPSRAQADASELRRALIWLEMVLNAQSGSRPMAGFWRIYEIPLEAYLGDYLLADYDNEAGTQEVFSVSLVDSSGRVVDSIDIEWEDEGAKEDLSQTGTPCRAVITRDVSPELRLYPTPTQADQDNGLKIRVRVQTFHHDIDPTGVADNNVLLRPSWYLWAIKRLAYEIGGGPVRRLPDSERNSLKNDYMELEANLMGRDGRYNSARPPITDPPPGA